jgi:hypothetical protein
MNDGMTGYGTASGAGLHDRSRPNSGHCSDITACRICATNDINVRIAPSAARQRKRLALRSTHDGPTRSGSAYRVPVLERLQECRASRHCVIAGRLN